MHHETLWACDFFSKRIVTRGGVVEYFVLAFIHVASRRVRVTAATANPNGEWVAQQARNFCADLPDDEPRPTIMLRDGDKKFECMFDRILESEGIRANRLPPRSPNLNAHIERWILSVKSECLDHFIVLGERHLNYLVREYVDFYNNERPHQGLGNVPIGRARAGPVQPELLEEPTEIACSQRLGGLLKHYYRRAA